MHSARLLVLPPAKMAAFGGVVAFSKEYRPSLLPEKAISCNIAAHFAGLRRSLSPSSNKKRKMKPVAAFLLALAPFFFSGEKDPQIITETIIKTDTQYDNLNLAIVFEKGRAEVVHLKYGKETP